MRKIRATPVFFQSELGKALSGKNPLIFSRYTAPPQTKTGLSISAESRFVIELLVEARGVEPPSAPMREITGKWIQHIESAGIFIIRTILMARQPPPGSGKRLSVESATTRDVVSNSRSGDGYRLVSSGLARSPPSVSISPLARRLGTPWSVPGSCRLPGASSCAVREDLQNERRAAGRPCCFAVFRLAPDRAPCGSCRSIITAPSCTKKPSRSCSVVGGEMMRLDV